MNINQHLVAEFLKHIDIIPAIAAGVVVFFFFQIFGIILGKILSRFLSRYMDTQLSNTCAKILKLAFVVMGIITGLGTMGVNINGLVATMGLTSIAIGMSVKDAFTNGMYGFMIAVYRPFVVGDSIAIGEHSGTVVDINLRYTTIEYDLGIKLIPNSKIFTEVITKHGSGK